MIIKQRWYRGKDAVQNETLRKILQGIGDSGINVFPVKMSFNQWLYQNQAAGFLFNYGTYAGAFAVEYQIYNLSYSIGTAFWNNIFDNDNNE